MRAGQATALAALLALANPAAAADQDGQLWIASVNTARLAARWDAMFEVQTRTQLEASTEGQRFLRPSITWRGPRRTLLTVGYLYARDTRASGRVTTEHRPWQQLITPIAGTEGRTRLDSRTRLEQRFLVGERDVAWRARQLTRLETPLAGSRGPGALLWNETFLNLDSARWGPRRGIEQVRWFAGLNVPLTGRVRIEPGYLNQWLIRPGQDHVNHAAVAFVFARF